MSNFKGYYMKCNGCTFQDPAISREGYEFFPYLIQVADSGQVASGKLTIKVLPHIRRKINLTFPPMTPEQFRVYSNALRFKEKGKGMYLTIEAYDDDSDTYITDLCSEVYDALNELPQNKYIKIIQNTLLLWMN